MNKRLTALSLFAGAGGLDIGFHQEGFDIVACIELEEIFCQTLELNRGRYLPQNCQIIKEDIQAVDPSRLGIGHVDLIIGGPPCQSFSAAGRRAGGVTGILDERGSLFEQYGRFVEHFQPEAFVFENVRGILNANKGRDWQEILKQFEPLKYSLYYRVLDAADYGVPQYRERLILVGIKKNSSFLFPRPTHGPDSLDGRPHVTAGEAIADLQQANEPFHKYGGKYGHLLEQVPPGMNYHFFTRELGYPEPIFAWRSRFSDFLYKAAPDKPAKTIVAKLGRYSGPFHWKVRKFSLAEFKRLQSFPDDYEIAGSLGQQLQQIGNSVAPKFSRALAKAIKYQLFDKSQPVGLIAQDYQLSFDGRKGVKAKNTRKAVLNSKSNGIAISTNGNRASLAAVKSNRRLTELFFYSSSKARRAVKPSDEIIESTVRFDIKREGKTVYVDVSRYWRKRFLATSAIQYTLDFIYPIGDGVSTIKCQLATRNGEDIPTAWDAIERSLRLYSGYHSLMDIYGHFTEPHPIFDLTCDIKSLKDHPIFRFAQHFSDFENTRKILPAENLREIMGCEGRLDFAETVKHLRRLRFDVRVHETNLTIPPGMFRCCYPFTLGYDKQVSVTWKERESGNHELMI